MLEFSTRQYLFAHGKFPKGIGSWAFLLPKDADQKRVEEAAAKLHDPAGTRITVDQEQGRPRVWIQASYGTAKQTCAKICKAAHPHESFDIEVLT